MVWVVFALMTGAAVFSVLWPLSQARSQRVRSDADATFYKAQLVEVERDAARGMIAPGELEPARAEVARRFLAAADRRDQEAGTQAARASTGRHRIAAAVLALVLVPATALGVYSFYGRPDAPDEPLTPRLAASGTDMDLGMAIARLEARLAAHPEDGHGWSLIAPVYFRLQRWDEAAKAYREAIQILGSKPEWQEAFGEARVQAAQGAVDEEALAAFQTVLKTEPTSPRAGFFIGLAAEQRGKIADAIAAYAKVAADHPSLPMVKAIQAHIETLRRPGAGAVASLAPRDRDTAIRGMVEGLAQKLAQDGKNPEGWLRLVRSYVVLKEPEKARAALGDAHKALAGDTASLGRLDDLARELGIGGT